MARDGARQVRESGVGHVELTGGKTVDEALGEGRGGDKEAGTAWSTQTEGPGKSGTGRTTEEEWTKNTDMRGKKVTQERYRGGGRGGLIIMGGGGRGGHRTIRQKREIVEAAMTARRGRGNNTGGTGEYGYMKMVPSIGPWNRK